MATTDTDQELAEVNSNSYNNAKELVKQELNLMKIEKTHPLVRQEYQTNNATTSNGSLLLGDAQLLKKFNAQRINNNSPDKSPSLIDSIDLKRYTEFTTEN